MVSCKSFYFLILLMMDLLNLAGLIGIYVLLNNKDVPFSPVMIVVTDFILLSSRILVLLYLVNANESSCFELMYFQYIAFLFNSILRVSVFIYFLILMYNNISTILQISYCSLIPTPLVQLIMLIAIHFSIRPIRHALLEEQV